MSEIKTLDYTYITNPFIKVKIFSLATFENLAKAFMFSPHRLNFYGIIIFTQGTGGHYLDNKFISIKAGDIIVLGPGQIHAFEKTGNLDGYVLSISEEFFTMNVNEDLYNENFEILQRSAQVSILNLSDQYFELATNVLESALHEYDRKDTAPNAKIIFYLVSSFMQILKGLLSESSYNTIELSEKEKVLSYSFKLLLSKHIDKERLLKFYLDKLGVSQSTLQNAVRKTFDKTPKIMLDEALVMRAKRMLSDPTKRIQEVSIELGFSEATNFSKFFKKNIGLTPEAFRSKEVIL